MRRRIIAGLIVVATGIGAYTVTVIRSGPEFSPRVQSAPAVTGTAEVGQPLSCAPGTWSRSPTAITIEWLDSSDAVVAPGSPYTIASTDEGEELRCRVTAANAGGSGKAISTATATIPVANPLLIVSDSFTDTDAVLLQDHTGEVGATWTKHPSYTGESAMTLNRATSDGGGDGSNGARSRYYASGVPSGANYDVECVYYWDSTIVGDRADCYGRLSTTVDTAYQVRWNQPSGGWQLTKINATVLTVLGSTYADMPANGTSRTVRLKMRGSTLKVYIDGTLRITQTDSSITAAGRAGIGERFSTATTGVHVDSIVATLPSPTEPDCANGADDDSDTFIDLADPGCSDENDTDETDAPPPPDPLCDDGIDNDSPADGLIDYQPGQPLHDPGCADASDNDEYDEPPPPPPGEPVANLFIDTNGGTCTRFPSVSESVDAAGCASMTAAYSAASLGDLVYIKAGTYGPQAIAVGITKGSPDSDLDNVDFQAAPGEAVTITSVGPSYWAFTTGAAHIRLADVTLDGGIAAYYRPEGAERAGDVHFDNITTNWLVQFYDTWNFSFTNSEIDGTGVNAGVDGLDVYGSSSNAGCQGHCPKNGLIEGNDIHDLGVPTPLPEPPPHVDGIQFAAGNDVVVRSVRFWDIANQDMLLKGDAGPIYDVTIENSMFGAVDTPGFSLQFRLNIGPCNGNIVRNNSFEEPPTANVTAATQCSGILTGNIWPSLDAYQCARWQDTWTASYNVSETGTACGTNGHTVADGNVDYVGRTAEPINLRLQAGSEAIDRGNPASYPTTDFDGTARFLGSAPDAGVHEKG